ncbi:ATP-binding protein [Geminicoccus harenae]|uniref:ATP-binding protein n=1 Tax=Geminicoccus harenae TaxID=2498453 RepID=UPI00168B98FA|nr:MASE1 domain-containing protein [Geminicoccus harenae]
MIRGALEKLRPSMPAPGVALAVPLAYFGAGLLSLMLTETLDDIAAVWFATAILYAALLRHQPRTWICLTILACMADFASGYVNGTDWRTGLANTAIAASEALLGAWLIRRFGGPGWSINTARGAVIFALVAILLPVASATAAAAQLFFRGLAPFGIVWSTWYTSEVLGLLLVVPFVLSWTEPGLWREKMRRSIIEAVLLSCLMAVLAALVFAESLLPTYFTFPLLLLAIFRTGLRGSSLMVIVLAVLAIQFTMAGHGPLLRVFPDADTIELMFALQLYLAVALLSTLPMAVVLSQREVMISELVSAKAAAEAAGRAKSQFLAAMSHEIRTPMTGVLGMADLLAAEPLEPRQQAYLRAIHTSGQHLLHVINDVLDFSRLESGGVVLEQVDFSVPELLEQVQMIMSSQAAERGLRLSFDLDEHSPPVVRGDPTRLRQVLVNLIGNALKFTSEGGVQVRIGHTPLPDGRIQFRFDVQDTGIGIAEERLEQLFRPFTQADQSISRRFGGSGLGLTICRQLVTAMGGEIGATSVAGRGSRFFFTIPFAPGDAVVAARKMTAPPPRPTQPLRVLVADDVEINRDLLHAGLTREGHHVSMAANGEQAVAKVAGEDFDVVLMDVQMPIMDGIEATRRIRSLPPPRNAVSIIAVTANVMEAERQRCLAAGMSQVLMKPVIWDELFRALPAGQQEVQAAQVPEGRPPELGEPLLDRARIEGLEAMAGPEKLTQFLSGALSSAEQLAAEVERLQEDLQAVAGPAHRLAGTAPSFGLLRIGVLARSIEQRAKAGRETGDLVVQLRQAVETTREEMRRLQLLPSPH